MTKVFYFILAVLTTVIYTCGLRNHAESGFRSLKFFESKHKIYKNLLYKHFGTFQASLTISDWGFICRPYDPYSRHIHRTPMIDFSVKYFREKYGNDPKKWNEDAQHLVVTLLGIQSHYISDMVWHSILGVQQGWILENAKVAFKGSFDRSHENADPGGDMVMSQQLDQEIVSDNWYLPSRDLTEIYHKFTNNTELTKYALDGCAFLQYLIVLGEKYFAHLVFSLYARQSIFLVDDLYHYPIGGVDDMVNRNLHYWRDMIKMIEKGTPRNISYSPSDESTSHFESKEDSLKFLDKFKAKIMEVLKPKMKRTENGVHFYTENTMKSIQKESENSYFYAGFSLAKYKNSVVESSPGFGTGGHPNTGKIRFINEKYDIIGQHASEKFGSRVAFLDFNQDGKIDLVVSAPDHGATEQNLYPKGAVYIYIGNGTMYFKSKPDITILGDFGNKDQFSSIGRELAIGDINGDGFDDLIIGSPLESNGRGSVTVYHSRKLFKKQYQNVKDADHALTSPTFSYFGHKLKMHKNFLFVGAPKNSQNGIDSRGCLHGYEVRSNKITPKFSIIGSDKFDQTGMNFAIGDPFGKEIDVMAVSSPTRQTMNPHETPQGGMVSILELSKLNGNLELKNIQYITRFIGNRAYSRLGWEIGFGDLNGDGVDDLWFSEPMKASKVGRDTGIVYFFKGGLSFTTGDILDSEKKSNAKWIGSKKQGRFGYSIISAVSNSKNGLYISSPFANENGGRCTGLVEFKSLP